MAEIVINGLKVNTGDLDHAEWRRAGTNALEGPLNLLWLYWKDGKFKDVVDLNTNDIARRLEENGVHVIKP